MDIIEKAARAINPFVWNEGPDREAYRRDAKERARAVLLAIREPTDAMISEAIIERHAADVPEAWSLATANIWRTMIDVALAE